MHYFSREAFWFDDEEYAAKLRKVTPDKLWERECLKYRTTVASGCGVAFSSLMMIPTLGIALPGLVISGRTLDIARRKSKIIESEIDRRNLKHYERKKRDIAIPIGISLMVWSTVGVIDILCLTGTSSAIAHDAGGSIFNAIEAMFQHPGDFFTATWQGFALQGEQFFHFGGDQLAIRLDDLSTMLDASGCHAVADNPAMPTGAPHTVLTDSLPVSADNTEAGTSMQHAIAPAAKDLDPLSHGSLLKDEIIPRGDGAGAIKAVVADALHQAMASNQPGGHAELVSATDKFINNAAVSGNEAHLAGIGTGMLAAATIEKQVASTLIANTGLLGVKTSIRTSSGPPSDYGSTENERREEMLNKATHEIYSQVLTGAKQRSFLFLSDRAQPISQKIVTALPSQQCCHDLNEQGNHNCHFCNKSIEVEKEAYYHCCRCSTPATAGLDICEVCVAGLGCGCTKERNHYLFRKGLLSNKVDFGKLEGLKKKEDVIIEANPADAVTQKSPRSLWNSSSKGNETANGKFEVRFENETDEEFRLLLCEEEDILPIEIKRTYSQAIRKARQDAPKTVKE